MPRQPKDVKQLETMAKESGKSSNAPSVRSALNNGQEARLLREKLLLPTFQVRDFKLLETSVF